MAMDSAQIIPAQTTSAAPSLTDALLPALTPVVQQAVSQVTNDLQTRLASVESQLTATLTAQAPAAEAHVLVAGSSVLMDIEHDVVTQRILVCSVVGAALAAALVILVAALLGNHTASSWIAAAPALLGAAVLWISNTSVSLPKRGSVPTPTVAGGKA